MGRYRLLSVGSARSGGRRQVRDEHQGERERVGEEARGVHARHHVDEDEDQHDRPRQERRAVAQAHRREVPGLRPALRERRRVEGEAEERRGQADRGEDVLRRNSVQQRVERPNGVAESVSSR